MYAERADDSSSVVLHPSVMIDCGLLYVTGIWYRTTCSVLRVLLYVGSRARHKYVPGTTQNSVQGQGRCVCTHAHATAVAAVQYGYSARFAGVPSIPGIIGYYYTAAVHIDVACAWSTCTLHACGRALRSRAQDRKKVRVSAGRDDRKE